MMSASSEPAVQYPPGAGRKMYQRQTTGWTDAGKAGAARRARCSFWRPTHALMPAVMQSAERTEAPRSGGARFERLADLDRIGKRLVQRGLVEFALGQADHHTGHAVADQVGQCAAFA